MNAGWRRLLAPLCLAVSVPAGLPAVAGEHEVRVVAVAEGDLLAVTDPAGNRYELRLAGVDAPELDQPFGAQARDRLAELALGRPARLEWNKVDRYGRAVGRLWVVSPDMTCRDEPACPRTLDAGYALVSAGLAWHFKRYQAEQDAEDRARYASEEDEARARRRGLWGEPDPVPPWEWREGRRDR